MRGLQEGIVKMTRYELETTPSRCQMFGEKAGLRSKQVRLLTIKWRRFSVSWILTAQRRMTGRYINLNASTLEAAPTCKATSVAVRLNHPSRFPSGAVSCLITTQPPVATFSRFDLVALTETSRDGHRSFYSCSHSCQWVIFPTNLFARLAKVKRRLRVVGTKFLIAYFPVTVYL
jgi:hypothetical protein